MSKQIGNFSSMINIVNFTTFHDFSSMIIHDHGFACNICIHWPRFCPVVREIVNPRALRNVKALNLVTFVAERLRLYDSSKFESMAERCVGRRALGRFGHDSQNMWDGGGSSVQENSTPVYTVLTMRLEQCNNIFTTLPRSWKAARLSLCPKVVLLHSQLSF